MMVHRRATLMACLVFPALAVRAQTADFPGGGWVVEAMGGTPVDPGTRADITFTAESRVHGRSFCNRFMGSFTVDATALRFGPAAGTRMACEEPAMAMEQRFHAGLEAVRGWRLDGAALLLTDGGGDTVLRLVRR